MAKKKNDGASTGILIVIGLIIWGLWIAVKALIEFNNQVIQAASGPAGIVCAFFGLLILISFLIKRFIYRGFNRKEEELKQSIAELEHKEAGLHEQVQREVDSRITSERKKLRSEQELFDKTVNKATKALQRIVDSAYKFSAKTLLAGVTINNWQVKYDQLRKETDSYADIRNRIHFLGLEDNSDWEGLKQEFLDKVAFLQKAQEEKEYQAEIKQQMREEKQRQDELDRQQREAEEEAERLAEQQRLIEEALAQAEGSYKAELEKQKLELEQQIADVHKQYERAKSMAQMTRQGHVYIISNIGSFGENVYKVGMTRRLEPMERIKELSDASVPFDFDVHAMISCDDAPALERALHSTLEAHRINKVNLRKEFFRVELEKIISEVKRQHGSIEYIADPAALQYWQSQESDGENVAA